MRTRFLVALCALTILAVLLRGLELFFGVWR